MFMTRAEQRFASKGIGTMEDPIIPEADVNVQDATTDTVILPLVDQQGTTTLAVEAIIETYEVSVADSTGMVVGDHFRIINTIGDRYYAGTVIAILGNLITLDCLLDFAYLVGSEVTWGDINMAVDGSITPVHFHLRTGAPSIPSSIDIVRMIMVCQTSSAVDLNKFGNLTALTRGILFRIENGHIRNIFCAKTNADLANLAFDWNPYVASNPSQAVDGFSWRLTFGSQGKIGVVLRVESDGQLGLIVQDDLSTLVSLKCIVEGHVTNE